VRNVDCQPLTELPVFRRIALGTWGEPADPSIYGSLTVRMEHALAYLEEARRRTGIRLTITHLVVKALALAIRACPQANVVMRWGRLYQRRAVDISVLVSRGGDEPDLSATKVAAADGKDLGELARELAGGAAQVRAGGTSLEATRRSLMRVPALLMRPFLKLITFLTHTLNLDLSRFGVPRDPFGSAVVTSLGSLGLESAFVPLVAYSRAPMVVAPGRVTEQPVVEHGRVVPGKVMSVNVTLDHRMIDGAHAAVLARVLRQVLEDPFTHLPFPEGERAPEGSSEVVAAAQDAAALGPGLGDRDRLAQDIGAARPRA
jgi:pyruvate/2-oxoglutarate dehydrogenase complex dihydrolipoamide acyltransferase (E2) component